MKLGRRNIATIVLTGMWINASEFFRNQILLIDNWVDHFQALGMEFPSTPLNAIVWVIWGFIFAVMIYILSDRFSLLETSLVSWVIASGISLIWLALRVREVRLVSWVIVSGISLIWVVPRYREVRLVSWEIASGISLSWL